MKKLLLYLLNLLFPARCIFCRDYLPWDAPSPFCPRCAAEHPPLPPRSIPIDAGTCYYVLDYREGVRRAILAFKFQGMAQYAAALGPLLAPLAAQWGQADCVTWAPVSPLRLQRRGYDQSRLLAEAVGRALDIPVIPLLHKRRHNRRQSRLPRDKRRDNVRGVYAVTERNSPLGLRVLLIDDIVTTGATLSACCQTLYAAGAREVLCAALAH